MPDFLLEIGTEEIPDWMIKGALLDLRAKFEAAFGSFGGTALRTEATPRRLVLMAEGLAELAPDTQTLVQGPYLSAGPKAAEGFARKNNKRQNSSKPQQTQRASAMCSANTSKVSKLRLRSRRNCLN